MPKLTVDGVEVEFDQGMTVLQACELAGAEIPRFCYHDRLSVAGNCRMCLVELEKAPKPIASCAFPAGDGMVVSTKSASVKKARKGVMEFLLINHPLDCPICDQGGECDLQDQAMAFGFDKSRYEENKRAVPDKYMGPLINTIMTRCIQCTRCVRFATEIAGVEELGLVNRGELVEISSIEKAVNSELSGNLIDICPVGALTSKSYAFSSRPWELRKTPSIDVMDAVGSNIRIDSRGREVLRVLPRLHEDINEEWIGDKSRYAIDGLRRQRLDKPYVRIDGKLQAVSWDVALKAVTDKLKATDGSKIGAIAGDTCDAESMFALKGLMDGLGSKSIDCRQDGVALGGHRSSYIFNTTIAGIEDADAVLLVGTDPRWEAPLVNARIRKRFLEGGLTVAGIGQPVDLTFQVDWVGQSAADLKALLTSRSDLAATLKNAENPMIIVGTGALNGADGAAVLALAGEVAEKFGMIRDDWNGFNALHQAASRVAGLDMGFVPGGRGKNAAQMAAGAMDVVYLLAADEIDMSGLENSFVIYQGHHGDAGAHGADVILPGAAYTEKNGTYVNMEGRAQLANMAGFPPGDAREDWTIIRAIAGQSGVDLGYNNLNQLRQALVKAVPTMGAIDQIIPAKWKAPGKAGAVSGAAFELTMQNYYMTDPISRASATMAECTDVLVNGNAPNLATGTEG
jgi:NADH-quinone oxidoreductase subunit G